MLGKVYLSGAMEGRENLNRPAFAEAEALAYEQGAQWVFNPCEYFRANDEMPDWPRSKFMLHDLRMLLESDVLVALDGADESRGARLEMMVAQACGINMIEVGELR